MFLLLSFQFQDSGWVAKGGLRSTMFKQEGFSHEVRLKTGGGRVLPGPCAGMAIAQLPVPIVAMKGPGSANEKKNQ